MLRRRVVAAAGALALVAACRFPGTGPTDAEVTAAVQKSPPAPPTLGPSFLSELTSVKVEERGRYNGDGKYWPVRVRVQGSSKAKLTGFLALTLADAARNQKPQPVEFVEEARLSKDDFGGWRVTYKYDPAGPMWRLSSTEASRAAQ